MIMSAVIWTVDTMGYSELRAQPSLILFPDEYVIFCGKTDFASVIESRILR